MTIIVNGEKQELEENTSLLALLKKLSLQERVMAAALNMTIVKQDAWESTFLKDGDKLELLDFVGGG